MKNSNPEPGESYHIDIIDLTRVHGSVYILLHYRGVRTREVVSSIGTKILENMVSSFKVYVKR